jgi:hypothetical protein
LLKTSSGVASKSAQQPLTKKRPDQGRLPIDNEAGAELQLNGIGPRRGSLFGSPSASIMAAAMTGSPASLRAFLWGTHICFACAS